MQRLLHIYTNKLKQLCKQHIASLNLFVKVYNFDSLTTN